MFFFISSRRRHTRYIGDWSSDVCSSDLVCDGNESDIVSIVAGNGFNAATVGLPADVGYGETVGVWDTTCWSADAVVVNKRTNHLPGITRDKVVSFGIKAREACIRT